MSRGANAKYKPLSGILSPSILKFAIEFASILPETFRGLLFINILVLVILKMLLSKNKFAFSLLKIKPIFLSSIFPSRIIILPFELISVKSVFK